MTVFENREKMYQVLGGLFKMLLDNENFAPKYVKQNIVIHFKITDPQGDIWVTPGDGTRGEVICGPSDIAPTVEMILSGDTCHKFWLKQISMPVAIAKGLIKAKGPMPKVLKLLPLLKPAYEAYPDHAKSFGLSIEK